MIVKKNELTKLPLGLIYYGYLTWLIVRPIDRGSVLAAAAAGLIPTCGSLLHGIPHLCPILCVELSYHIKAYNAQNKILKK